MNRILNQISTKYLTAFVVVSLWVWMSLLFLGSRPWSSRGEPREALVAQSMVNSGNYVLGAGYGGIVPSKPPVLHWSAAVASLPFGEVTEFSMRAPSAFAALILIFGVLYLAQSWIAGPAAVMAPLILASSLEFYRAGVEARVDMILCFAMFGAFLAGDRFLRTRTPMAAIGTALLLAIAILAKGPVGLVLPCGALTLFYWVDRRAFRAPFLLLIPAALGLLAAGWWYWEAYKIGGAAFFERVKYENVLRFLGSQEDQPHRHSAFYLIGMLLLGMLPWCLLVTRGAPKNWFSNIKGWYRGLSEPLRLMVYWCVIVTAFFCIPSGKRSVYLLPIYPAVALLIASRINLESGKRIFKITGGIFIFAAALSLAIDFGGIEPGMFGQRFDLVVSGMHAAIENSATIIVCHAVLLICGVALMLDKAKDRLVSNGLIYCIALGAIHGGLLSSGARWLSAKPFAATINAQLLAESAEASDSGTSRLLSFGHEFYGLSFYLNRKISRAEEFAPKPGDIVFTYEDKKVELESKTGMKYEFFSRALNPIDEAFSTTLALRAADSQK